MSTYQEFIAARLVELDYADSRTEPFIRAATVRQLRELSRKTVDFLDASYEFDTVAGQDNYSAGHTGFPVDLYAWVGEPYVINAGPPVSLKHYIHGPVPISEVRAAAYNSIASQTALYPSKFAWFNSTMWFSEVPSGVVTIRGDYRRDGRRDSSSGDLITVDSTTQTNGWFDEGENLLRVAVLLEYQESIGKDPLSISTYQRQMAALLPGLKEAAGAKKVGALQAGDSMFGCERDPSAVWYRRVS